MQSKSTLSLDTDYGEHIPESMDEYQEMQMEYDDATMQLNERVRKGLVTPDELFRDTELLDAAKEQLKRMERATREGPVPVESTPVALQQDVEDPHTSFGFSTFWRLRSLMGSYVKSSTSPSRLESSSSTTTLAEKSDGAKDIEPDALSRAVKRLKLTSMRRIKLHQLFHIHAFGLLPRQKFHKPTQLSMVPKVTTRRMFKYNVIGTLPERRHDLRLRWYKKNGPQLVNLASRVLSFQDIPNVRLDAQLSSLRQATEKVAEDLVDIAYHMHRFPRVGLDTEVPDALRVIDAHTQLLQNAFRLFGVSDRPGVEKLLTEASDLVQSPSWQAVEVIVSRVRNSNLSGRDNRKVIDEDVGLEFAVQTMKSCNIHVDLSDQSMFNWQPLSDQGAFGDIYTATIPERVIRPSGSTSRLIKVVAKIPARDEVKRHASDNAVIWKRIAREARAQGNAHQDPHPNILHITAFLNISSLSEYPSLITPWCDGGDLISYLASTKVGYVDRLRLALEVAMGVAHLHNLEHPGPIIHGDLRSLNVLIHDGHVKLADFGLSHIPNADKGLTSKLRGNGRWLAPEIKEAIRNKTEYELTKESDMFSFGHVFLEAITGHYPFEDISDSNELDDVCIDEYHKLTEHASTVLDVHWRFMLECWSESGYRPTATEAVEFLTESHRELSTRPDPPDPSEFIHTDT